jgi:hypothetical protein
MTFTVSTDIQYAAIFGEGLSGNGYIEDFVNKARSKDPNLA